MLSYDQAAAKMQWREAVRAVTEAIEDAGGVVNNVNDAKLDAVEAWIGESRRCPSLGGLGRFLGQLADLGT
jgi:hypothetical protein